MHFNKSKLIILILINFCNVPFVLGQIFEGADSQQFYNFIKLVHDPVKHISVSKNLEAVDEEDRTYVNELHRIIQESLNPILSEFIISSNASKCSQDFQYVTENLTSLGWAFRMLDAYGKPESGLFVGNTKWLGEYDECLGIYAPPKANDNVGNFHGRYCTLTIPLNLQNRSLPITVGVCLPDSCNPSGSIFNYTQINLNGSFPEYEEVINTFLNETVITCQQTERKYYTGAIAVMFLISLFGLLAVIGSLITVYEYLMKAYSETYSLFEANASENLTVNADVGKLSRKITLPVWLEKCNPFFNCFCFLTNGEKILNTDSTEGQLPCLHGIRFLSMSWVILCHTYAVGFTTLRNPAEIVDAIDKWSFQIILNGFFSVDSFFLLSGFLVAYIFFQQSDKSNGKIPWVYFYVHRYIRLTPVYMIVAAFYATLMPHLSTGPIWPAAEVDKNCKESWWLNILYINNFQDAADQCMGWSWYLANDMQFYVISPLFLVTLWRWPKIGYSVMGCFFCITFILNFVLTYEYDLFTGLGNVAQQADTIGIFLPQWRNFFNILYIKPYTRVGPYLVGISLAYYLYKRKKNDSRKLNWVILSIGWIVATSVTLACLFGLYHRSPPVVAASFYNALNRVLFACGLAWVIFVCVIGQGGAVNSILSWKVWIPLSRLTFSAYLVHPVVLSLYFYSLRKLVEFSQMTLITIFLGLLIMSYGLALLTSLLFESPVIRLERFIRNKFTS